MIDVVVRDLFGRHIGGRADDDAFHRVCEIALSFAVGLAQFCQTEIENFHVTVGANHDVFRLDVAVNDSGLCAAASASQTCDDDRKRFFELQIRSLDQLAHGFAFDKFGGDVIDAVRRFRLRKS